MALARCKCAVVQTLQLPRGGEVTVACRACPHREQGFVNGLALQPNGYTAARQGERQQREQLLELTDMLRVALAGNLRGAELQDRTGKTVKG